MGANGAQWIEIEPRLQEGIDVTERSSIEGGDEMFESPRLRPTFYEFSKTLPVLNMDADNLFSSGSKSASPMVYVVVIGCEGLERVVPLEFLLLDCSKMLISSGNAHASMQSSLGFNIEFSISSLLPLMSKPAQLRALFLDVVR